MLDANKYIDRLRQTVKDVRSFKNDGRGVSFTVEKRFEYHYFYLIIVFSFHY